MAGVFIFLKRTRTPTTSVTRTGIEQPAPPGHRPGRQQRPCGALLGRGRFPGHQTKTPAANVAGAFIFLKRTRTPRTSVTRAGIEQPAPPGHRPGRCGRFLILIKTPNHEKDFPMVSSLSLHRLLFQANEQYASQAVRSHPNIQ